MSRKPTRTRRRINSSSWSVRFGQSLRRYFFTGLATLFPVAVTLWLVITIFRIADGLVGRYVGFSIPGLGLLVTAVVILIVGVLSVHFFGRVLFQTLEALLSRLPLAKSIFPAVKQLAQFLFKEQGGTTSLLRVVLVEYPRLGAHTIAFVMSERVSAVTGASQKLLTLLIPTPPSPWSGPIIFLPEQETIPLTLSVEEALKLVLSGGIVLPSLEAATRRE